MIHLLALTCSISIQHRLSNNTCFRYYKFHFANKQQQQKTTPVFNFYQLIFTARTCRPKTASKQQLQFTSLPTFKWLYTEPYFVCQKIQRNFHSSQKISLFFSLAYLKTFFQKKFSLAFSLAKEWNFMSSMQIIKEVLKHASKN